jgi:hypothetical protein
VIIEKLSNNNIVQINAHIDATFYQFILTKNLQSIKLYYDGTTIVEISIDKYDGETEHTLEPTAFTSTSQNVLDLTQIDNSGNIAMSTNLNMNNKRIQHLSDPIDPSDVATKRYVDNLIIGSICVCNVYYKLPIGTVGGLPVKNTWTTYKFNVLDDIQSTVLLNNNVITMQIGVYKLLGQFVFNKTLGTSIRIRNIANNDILHRSLSTNVVNNQTIDITWSYDAVSAVDIVFEYFVTSDSSNTGLGFPLGIDDEIYGHVIIERYC